MTSPPTRFASHTVEDALRTGALGSACAYLHKPALSPAWGRRLTVKDGNHEARWGLACWASYTFSTPVVALVGVPTTRSAIPLIPSYHPSLPPLTSRTPASGLLALSLPGLDQPEGLASLNRSLNHLLVPSLSLTPARPPARPPYFPQRLPLSPSLSYALLPNPSPSLSLPLQTQLCYLPVAMVSVGVRWLCDRHSPLASAQFKFKLNLSVQAGW